MHDIAAANRTIRSHDAPEGGEPTLVGTTVPSSAARVTSRSWTKWARWPVAARSIAPKWVRAP